MVECFRCGIDEEKAVLFEAISNEGIVKICEDCVRETGMPLIRRPTDSQINKAQNPESVYDRLSYMAGINAKEHKEKLHGVGSSERVVLRQDTTFRDLVDRNYEKKFGVGVREQRPDLVDNFHWVIMRARRFKKMSPEQVAVAIGESEDAVKMAEAGALSEDYDKLISKLQSFLGVKIFKKDTLEDERNPKKRLAFDPETLNALTIADLREMKKQREMKKIVEEDEDEGDEEGDEEDIEIDEEEIEPFDEDEELEEEEEEGK